MSECPKDTKIILGILFTVVIFVAGTVINQQIKANGDIQITKQDLQRQYDELKKDTNDKLSEIKSDVKDTRKDVSEIKTFLINQKP